MDTTKNYTDRGPANLNNTEVTLERHAKIAQVLVQKVEHPDIVEVTGLEQENTERGEKGFGSSG